MHLRRRRWGLEVMTTYTPYWYRMSMAAGYPCVYCPDHPRAWSTGYIHAHVVVAEQREGRLLCRGEVVHHKNENKFDFSPHNLEITTANEHSRHHAKRGRTMVELTCLECGQKFIREKRRYNGKTAFCSFRCNGLKHRRSQIEAGRSNLRRCTDPVF